jgi:two-component system LytT family sensor kinase
MMARLRFLVLYLAAWLPAAALYSLLIYLQTNDRSVSGALMGGVQSVLLAALLGLPVWSVTQRFAEKSRSIGRVVAVHAGMGLAYALAWSGLITLSIALFAPAEVYTEFVRYALGWQFLTGLFVYGMVAGVAHALAVSKRLRREREASARAEALRTRAELSALRAQMNPHFLFNTLHSISALVRTDPQAVEDALERLAALFRRLLDVNRLGVDHLALAEEWEIVRDQLELEKLRFGDRLQVVSDIENDALECQIPVFTLQPLVENAVKHGVSARTQRCTIFIAARVRNDVLELEVRDDGPGADARAALSAPGLGLRAVRQRLMAQYGDRAGVHVATTPGAGFCVRVTLPAVAAPVPSEHARALTAV